MIINQPYIEPRYSPVWTACCVERWSSINLLSTCPHQYQWLVHQRPFHVLPCLCDNACKRSLVIMYYTHAHTHRGHAEWPLRHNRRLVRHRPFHALPCLCDNALIPKSWLLSILSQYGSGWVYNFGHDITLQFYISSVQNWCSWKKNKQMVVTIL